MISIKEKLIQKIESVEDETVLQELYKLLTKGNKDIIQLDENDITLVNEAREEYKNGYTSSHKELKNEFLTWKKK
jgi:hypothetical protein